MDNNIFSNIPRLLRYLGVLAIGSSATLALVQGVTSPISELTIGGFLSFIVALLGVGIFSGTRLKEGKGGRVSVGLALGLIAPFFALLGALFIRDVEYSTYWRIVPAISIETSIVLSIISMLVVIPTAILGFRVLHGEGYTKLSILFLLGASTLLIPLRDVGSVSVFIILSCAAAIYAKNFRSAGTLEEQFAKLILWITPVALAVRTIGAHPFEEIAHGMVLIVGGIVISAVVNLFTNDELLVKPFELISGLIGLVGAYLLTDGVIPYESNLLITFGSIIGVLVIGIAQLLTFAKREVENIGLGVILFVALLSPYSNEMILSCGVSLIFSVGFILLSIVRRSKILLGGGVIAFLVSVLSMLSTVVTRVDFGSWATLGVIGITVILISSILEKKLPILRAKFVEGYKELGTW